jgi:hypothetical protein
VIRYEFRRDVILMETGIPERGFDFAFILTVSVASALDVSVLMLCMQIVIPRLVCCVCEEIVGLNEYRRLQNQT